MLSSHDNITVLINAIGGFSSWETTYWKTDRLVVYPKLTKYHHLALSVLESTGRRRPGNNKEWNSSSRNDRLFHSTPIHIDAYKENL